MNVLNSSCTLWFNTVVREEGKRTLQYRMVHLFVSLNSSTFQHDKRPWQKLQVISCLGFSSSRRIIAGWPRSKISTQIRKKGKKITVKMPISRFCHFPHSTTKAYYVWWDFLKIFRVEEWKMGYQKLDMAKRAKKQCQFFPSGKTLYVEGKTVLKVRGWSCCSILQPISRLFLLLKSTHKILKNGNF